MARIFKEGDVALGRNGERYKILAVDSRNESMPMMSRYTVMDEARNRTIANFPGYQFAESLRDKTKRYMQTETVSKDEWCALAKEWLENF